MKLNKRGEGNIGCILFLIIFVFILYVGYNVIPPYFNSMQFCKDVEQVTYKAGAFFWSKGRIEDKVLELAKEYNQPFTKRNLKIYMYRNTISVVLDYYVPLDLVVYKYNYHITKKYSSLRGGF